MFKRIKVITLLISVLLVLGIMQLISAGIFINALNNDKENFTVSQLSSQNVAEFTDARISLNRARVTLNRGMLRLQSSMASQINGGQLNELVNTAKNLLADAQTHYDKYYALPETPGMDEHRRSSGRAVPRLLRHADANERSAGAGQSGRYVQTKCRTEADRDAKGLSRVA